MCHRQILLPLAALAASATVHGAARTIAHLQDAKVTESSGVVASRMNPGIYWTHNDSGDGPILYAFDRNGRSHGRWQVLGARAVDWEDIAIGPGAKRGRPYLYVGDIGDNARNRREVVVYRVEEPERRPVSPGVRRGLPQPFVSDTLIGRTTPRPCWFTPRRGNCTSSA